MLPSIAYLPHRILRRLLLTVLLVVAMVCLAAVGAEAFDTDSGNKPCGPHYQRVRAEWQVEVDIYPAPSGYYWNYSGTTTWKVSTKYATGSGGGYWSAESNNLRFSGTYATCHNVRP